MSSNCFGMAELGEAIEEAIDHYTLCLMEGDIGELLESCKRLYYSGKITKEKLLDYVVLGVISRKEYEKIVMDNENSA